MNIRELADFLSAKNLPAFRLKQIIKAVYQDGVLSFSDISSLPKDLRAELSGRIKILSFEVEKVAAAPDKKAFKALLKFPDGNRAETVFLSPISGLWSACVSSQAGCAMACAFCATGAGGFKRNLTAEEISDQVLFWKQYFRKNNLSGNFSNIIYMGMGEPFMNYDEAARSIKTLADPDLFNFGRRHISVSTSGLPAGIKKFAKDFPQVNLAVSINAPTDEKRSELMPINRKYGLLEIRKALDFYFSKNRRKVFLEYILFDGVNDARQDADNLIKFIRQSARPDLLHINLIRYNAAADGFKPSKKEAVLRFKEYLLKNGVSATIRKSLGQEIAGACGQLAGKAVKSSEIES